MSRLLLLGAVVAVSVIVAAVDLVRSQAATAPASSPTATNWRLVFGDEFEDRRLDPSKWTTCYWWDRGGCTNMGNNERQWYQPQNAVVEDSILRLEARKQTVRASDGNTYQYTSGMVTSGRGTSDTSQSVRFAFRYGYVEMRARMPAGKGLWSAFWLLPASHESKPEIDVVEVLGHEPDRLHAHVHFLDEGRRASAGSSWVGHDASTSWHVYALEWRPDALTWYVDGVQVWRFTDSRHVPSEPMYVLANLAVGGDWPGRPDASTSFPSALEIDYLRVWQRGAVGAD